MPAFLVIRPPDAKHRDSRSPLKRSQVVDASRDRPSTSLFDILTQSDATCAPLVFKRRQAPRQGSTLRRQTNAVFSHMHWAARRSATNKGFIGVRTRSVAQLTHGVNPGPNMRLSLRSLMKTRVSI